ncbi:alpha/beta fold hydrolase [Xanthobacteraceae bacterium A53D]
MRVASLATALLILASPAIAQSSGAPPQDAQKAEPAANGAPAVRPYGVELQEFDYPHPVQRFEFVSQRKPVHMAYMDVKPEKANGRTVVLMHGKNFCGATWESVITPLVKAGYRVVVPDQIGFCKSSKPLGYQFSFHQLAANTKALLDQLGVEKPIVMGHSMGGMLATRYALSFPDGVSGLAMVNPIGLEDWRAKGVPARTVDQWYAGELRVNFEGIKAYQQATYYAGTWKPEYDRWVAMQAGMYLGEGKAAVAWNQALTSDMVYSQPVVYEFPLIRTPTLLLIGEKDNTAIGKAFASPEAQKKLGNYAELGPAAAKAIPGAKLVTFPDLGHSPQIQAPERFNEALLKGLSEMK